VVGDATFSGTMLMNLQMLLLWLISSLALLIAKDSCTVLKAAGSCEKVDPARGVHATPEKSGALAVLLGVSYAEQMQSAKRWFENVLRAKHDERFHDNVEYLLTRMVPSRGFASGLSRLKMLHPSTPWN